MGFQYRRNHLSRMAGRRVGIALTLADSGVPVRGVLPGRLEIARQLGRAVLRWSK